MSIAQRVRYLRRIFGAYLTGSESQLTFWHGEPQVNDQFTPGELGQYYMPFLGKADYTGHYDDRGIPLLDYHGAVSLQYNPIAIAQYGLGNYNFYCRTGAADRREKFVAIANWLLDNLEETPQGTRVWYHHFDWEYRDTLKSPWYSALAQGQGISLLLRAHKETGKPCYLEAATHAFHTFECDVTDGGVAFTDERGDLWFEEAIVDPPTHILNGFLWASWGVYDYAVYLQSDKARSLFADAVETLRESLQHFDVGYWSLYEQSGTRMKMLASPFYHGLHIVQLRILARLTGDPAFSAHADRWDDYRRHGIKRATALAYKAIFKLLYY